MDAVGGGIDVRRLARRLGFAALWVVAAWEGLTLVRYFAATGAVATDSHAYWLTGHVDGSLYGLPARAPDAFLYSPVFALAVRPLTVLPFPVFAVLWAFAGLAAVLWLLRPGPLRWILPLVAVAVLPELVVGNVYPFLALALVAAFAPGVRPAGAAALSFVLLTKLAPGLPILWYVLRRDWRRLGIAVGTTTALVVASLVVAPDWWRDWIGFLLHGDSEPASHYPLRVAVALGVLLAAHRWDRPALLPVVALLCLPVFGGPNVYVLLAAVPRLAGVSTRLPVCPSTPSSSTGAAR